MANDASGEIGGVTCTHAETEERPLELTATQEVHRTARAGIFIIERAAKQKAPHKCRAFVFVNKQEARSYLILVSLYGTCLRTTGSNLLISIFSGMLRLFFVVV